MSDKQETIADIIAEMHRFAKQHEYDHPDMDTNARGIEDYADRLEAAHRRELSKNVSKNGADFGQLGNAAKLREAIDKCVNLITEFGNAEIVKTPLDVIIDIEAILKAALAAPPRNCEVGTEQEQQDRFREFCRHYESEGECGIGRYEAACPAFQGGRNPDCSLWWANMPYEAEEGGAK